MVRIGAHVSTKGGILNSFDRALEIGAEAVQIHPTPPQTWRTLEPDAKTVREFHRRLAESGLGAFFFHAVYLINLATSREDLLASSQGALAHYLDLANRLAVTGVIFHPGSHMGRGFDATLPQMAAAIKGALQQAGGESRLLIENSAGAGNNVGSTFAQIRQLVEAVDDPRVGLCLDTAHAFTAGYDLSSPEGLLAMREELEREIGGDLLWAIHANDSKAPLGSNRDRHENIGEGHIGREAFRRMLHDPLLSRAPFILEVPGQERRGPDLANVQCLRELAGLVKMSA